MSILGADGNPTADNDGWGSLTDKQQRWAIVQGIKTVGMLCTEALDKLKGIEARLQELEEEPEQEEEG